MTEKNRLCPTEGMPVRWRLISMVCLALFIAPCVEGLKAEDLEVQKLLDLSLEELLNAEVMSVSVSKAQSVREAPGIVTVITSEDIRSMGARDLMEVLQLFPSVGFGVDVANVVGITFRGQWPHEGRILLRIDGQDMNELCYSNTQFGINYPIQSIDRIEFFRGPGSVNYGGFAEYGVINIISKKGAFPRWGRGGRVHAG
jgi:outer membrane receptor for ferrienterochelin and colicin